MDTDHLESIIDAYQRGEADSDALRHAGALFAFDGIAGNGGLVGGAIENCFHAGDEDTLVRDAVEAFRWYGLGDVADLIERADREYRRFRPTGGEDIDEADEKLWDELDELYEEVASDEAIESVVRRRIPELFVGDAPQ
ncbi:DMP19 family protein [Microbacterium sp. gxy059]|uniref:DMP19 family protein n=1 Tax=Microbacterium sp. gxy059 TaxID=2957199 RepID=UPI003D95F342